MSLLWSQPILNETPDFLTNEDEMIILSGTTSETARFYDSLIRKHGPHPFLLVGFARIIRYLGSPGTAIDLYHQASSALSEAGLTDPKLDRLIQAEEETHDRMSRQVLSESRSLIYRQNWKPTREHKFPLNHPLPPSQHEEIKSTWSQLFTQGSTLLRRYLDELSIETNHVESTFLITVGSTQDLIRRGILQGVIQPQGNSKIKDPTTIQSIINDTLAAYELLSPVVQDPSKLDADFIKTVHARLMRTCQFSSEYVPPGQTRTKTKQTVLIKGAYSIQCCPYPQVDEELDYICRMAKQYIANIRNPFASASWLHLVLARCHPFNDGNGRTTRLIASIPLLRLGYPPISIMLEQRSEYYEAINEAFNGDHGALIRCIESGMTKCIQAVQNI